MTRTEEELAKIGAEDIVLFNFDQVQAVTGWYLPRESYLYGGTPEKLIREMFPGVYAVPGEEWIDQQLESGKTVWFIGSGLARDGILKEWQKRGIKSVETADSCLLERYWFNIYRLGLQP